jgi:hypothetical protein
MRPNPAPTLAFRLLGYERVDGPEGGHGVVQEWHVEPPDHRGTDQIREPVTLWGRSWVCRSARNLTPTVRSN